MGVKHIGFFGRRNVGKSSLVNLLLGQDFAIVSDQAGTTTDPVKKRMELPEIGAVQLIDTAGIDDAGELGVKRVGKSMKVVEEIDLAILVFTANLFGKEEKDLLHKFREYDVPVVVVHNQSDIIPLDYGVAGDLANMYNCDVLEFSCCMMDEQKQREAVDMLVSFMIKGVLMGEREKSILHGLVGKGDNIVLVCPIDSEAPEGRLILPQVMAIRDILNHEGRAIVMQPGELEGYFANLASSGNLNQVKLVVTDSQAFRQVASVVPHGIPLTSFSILMARAKGPFDDYVKGLEAIDKLKEGDRILVLESCTHHTSCEDIGRVKIPAMLQKKCGCNLEFTFVSGLNELPDEEKLGSYALALQCGGCMVTRRQLCNRVRKVAAAGVPVTNYGMCIAYVTGIYSKISL